MKLAVTALLALLSAPALAAEPAAKGAPYVMPRSEVRDVTSKAGAAYRVYVAMPEAPPPPGGYPVLYLLDGDESFATTAEMANRFGIYWGLEPGVVVAIGYPTGSRRMLDDTPAGDPGDVVPAGTRTGGADTFLTFLGDELIPAIDAEHHIDPARRTLMGYSLGGLFTLHALFHRPGLFARYVAASPSIWFADKAVLGALPAFEQRMRRGDLHPSLTLTAGQYEQSPPPGGEKDPAWLKIAALSTKAAMVDNARALSQRLGGLPGLSVSFAVVPGETHATGDFPAIREALRRAFATAH